MIFHGVYNHFEITQDGENYRLQQNDLNPFDYLYFVFTMAPLVKNEQDWEALLPWNIKEDITVDKGPVFI